MKFLFAIRSMYVLSILFVGSLAAAPLPAGSGQPKAGSYRIIGSGENSLIAVGGRVTAKVSKRGTTGYSYVGGRLAKAFHSDGRTDTYSYVDGRLSKIESSDGSVQWAQYKNGVLVALTSSTGQKLGLARAAGNVDFFAFKLRPPGSKFVPLRRALTPAERTERLNYQLISVDNWAAHRTEWECTLQPEGDSVCIGRPDNPPPSVDDYFPFDPDPAPDNGGMSTRPEDGGAGVGTGANGQGPYNLPTRESCLDAVISSHYIMLTQICPLVTDQAVCMSSAQRVMEELAAECIKNYPA